MVDEKWVEKAAELVGKVSAVLGLPKDVDDCNGAVVRWDAVVLRIGYEFGMVSDPTGCPVWREMTSRDRLEWIVALEDRIFGSGKRGKGVEAPC